MQTPAEGKSFNRPAISKHIKILHRAGFISVRDIGRERHCTLQKDGFNALQEWIDDFDKFWMDKLKNLKTLIIRKGQKK